MNPTARAEQFLQDFHRRHPSCTPAAFAPSGELAPSYDALLDVLPPAPGITVLDLACGDGFLLERLQARRPDARLYGVDMSDGELAVARLRLPTVELRQERAQCLSLPDASVDVVVCHMAFMLMGELELVVQELSRVLKPGGIFSAVIGENTIARGGRELLTRLLKAYAVAGAFIPFGDPRTRTPEGLQSLFTASGGWTEPVQFRAIPLILDASPEAVWKTLSLTYNVAQLTPAEQAHMRDEFLRLALTQLDEQGNLPYRETFRQFTVLRSAAA